MGPIRRYRKDDREGTCDGIKIPGAGFGRIDVGVEAARPRIEEQYWRQQQWRTTEERRRKGAISIVLAR